MLKDDDFSKKASVDRYGRKIRKEDSARELERIYRVKGSEDAGSGDQRQESESDDAPDDDREVAQELERANQNYDPARDGGFSSSSEDSEEEDEEDIEDVDVEEEVFGFPDAQENGQNGVPMGDVSSRIAAVNLDWDHIRAADLLAVFSSFCPPTGHIKKIAVYPSEFGKERMEREEMEGPPPEIFAGVNDKRQPKDIEEEDSVKGLEEEGDDDEEADEEEEEAKIRESLLQEDNSEDFNSAKLRRYQLERLRYYYAVITVSSPETARALYDATDGTEYLTTANFFDLRFVPDDVSFDDEARDECESIPNGYKPNDFVTDALQHSKVRLTWDADDPARKESVKRAFTGSREAIDENDLKAYLASDTSDSDQQVEELADDGVPRVSNKAAERRRLRAALGLGEEPVSKSKEKTSAPVGDMQVTFTSGLSSKNGAESIFENKPVAEETTVERYVRKEKERKLRRKEKMKASRAGESAKAGIDVVPPPDSDGKEEVEADLGFNDPFFEDSKAENVAGQAKANRKAAKLARRAERETEKAEEASKRAELELLMVEDDHGTVNSPQRLAHFDINDVLKSEKASSKKRKGRKSKESTIKTGAQADFKMDVKDPRFSNLYDSHEYAIDPTNPKFKGTKGMHALLEEGRRKRTRDDDTKENMLALKRIKKASANDTDDLHQSMEKVKRKA